MSIPDAAAEDRRARESPQAWMLARFVCPASKLAELRAEMPWERAPGLSVVLDGAGRRRPGTGRRRSPATSGWWRAPQARARVSSRSSCGCPGRAPPVRCSPPAPRLSRSGSSLLRARSRGALARQPARRHRRGRRGRRPGQAALRGRERRGVPTGRARGARDRLLPPRRGGVQGDRGAPSPDPARRTGDGLPDARISQPARGRASTHARTPPAPISRGCSRRRTRPRSRSRPRRLHAGAHSVSAEEIRRERAELFMGYGSC